MNAISQNPVLTIGHSNHELPRFLTLLRAHGVSAIADVRSSPYSRSNPQFNQDTLRDLLKEVGIAYVFLGRELGGRPDDLRCYVDGKVQYQRLAQTDMFREGLRRVVAGAQSHRIALLCAEADPLVCHRTILVAQELTAGGVSTSHIHSNGMLESHSAAMGRLIRLLKLDDVDLYRSKEEIIADACALQAKRIAYERDQVGKQASA